MITAGPAQRMLKPVAKSTQFSMILAISIYSGSLSVPTKGAPGALGFGASPEGLEVRRGMVPRAREQRRIYPVKQGC